MTLHRIESREEVPLRGLRVDAKRGDWLIRDAGSVAVVSTATGALIDFGGEGGDDALVSIEPAVFLGLEQMTTVVESVEPAAGDHALLVRKRVLSDPPLRLRSFITFVDGALHIESVATAADQGALAATLGEVVAWGNVPTWVEGHGFVRGKATLPGDFIAREGVGVAYALAVEDQPDGTSTDVPLARHVVARFAEPGYGFHEWARTGERVESIPAWGSSRRRVVILAHGRGSLGNAALALPRFARGHLDRWPLPTPALDGSVVEVSHCNGDPFARFDGNAADLMLPKGCWRARFTAPGYAAGSWMAPDALVGASPEATRPQAGTFRWSVRQKGGGLVPARIVVRGLGTTADPNWGEDPTDGASLNVIYSAGEGTRPIPPGRYRVTITRGFEYTMRESEITVSVGKSSVVNAELERVVDTHGWITADLHVHANPSPDAPALLADRVRALAAAGVEVAVATDHNAITDYGPAIRESGLDPWLASVVGDEVTTRGVPLGHFNVFPLAPGSAPIPFERVTPPAVVGVARTAASRDRPNVIQLNHPRMGSIGYFELARFDPRDVAGWRSRSQPVAADFDAIEVFNGDDYAKIDEVERVMRDWYAMLDAGIRITATGNSDSHKLTYHECGVPRNLVQVPNDDPRGFDESSFVGAVRAGRVVVTSGPAVWLTVAGHGIGESANPGEQEVHVVVDAPGWVDVSRVELVRRGEVVHTWTGPFPNAVRRLDASLRLEVAKGDWLIAIARGERPMAFLARAGAKPFSFTNPVWIE